RKSEFWALNDISFELKRGEPLGLIGKNGSGKSTLLRLLNGIFPPDKGKITINGRIGGLIAVGAGFHPYMTGRENIFLNGAILGLTKSEIKQQMDSIIDFADIEEFIDAPVSTYSSGMSVRLGFAIAIHAIPDIVLLDEVFAVGDASFQSKCMGKINSIMNEKAVVFVSHSMYQIESLCKKVLWLEKGAVVEYGNTVEVINNYLDYQEKIAIKNAEKNNEKFESTIFDINRNYLSQNIIKDNITEKKILKSEHLIEVDKVEICDENGNVQENFPMNSTIIVKIYFDALIEIEEPLFNIRIEHIKKGIFECSMLIDGAAVSKVEKGKGVIECKIPNLNLTPKMYDIKIFVRDKKGPVDIAQMKNYTTFQILAPDNFKGPYAVGHLRHSANYFYIQHEWKYEKLN
ncbi:MAG: ABC transporter ATP-binding protein, partial [Bacteroidetes bacterium]|nr:ABC transporter ATP-binding protein [Bacteroidota bacterium]